MIPVLVILGCLYLLGMYVVFLVGITAGCTRRELLFDALTWPKYLEAPESRLWR